MRPYSAQPAILPKPEFTLDLAEFTLDALKILMYPQEDIIIIIIIIIVIIIIIINNIIIIVIIIIIIIIITIKNIHTAVAIPLNYNKKNY